MKTEHQISVEYRAAMRQVQELRRIAADIRKLSDDDMGGALQTLSAGWKGDNANAYLAKANKVKGNIQTIGANLQRVADALAQEAARVRAADLKAAQIAAQRNGG